MLITIYFPIKILIIDADTYVPMSLPPFQNYVKILIRDCHQLSLYILHNLVHGVLMGDFKFEKARNSSNRNQSFRRVGWGGVSEVNFCQNALQARGRIYSIGQCE